MNKTLKQLCIPRSFEGDHDVQDITDLIENKIKPEDFFKLNFRTSGMGVLLNTAFERFKGKSPQKLIKLTQSMGGGKTHNMISLGLLAKHPDFRKKILGKDYKDDDLGPVEVIAFSGRESDVKNGLWGEISRQIKKESEFKEYWENGLKAPGTSAWIKLLKGTPKLILFDELPPYLENAKTVSVADGNLSTVTTTALANLFNALNKDELANVLVVMSDLKATYESGSRLLQATFKELEAEVNRFALDIEPVGSSSDEIYDILRTRLFEKTADDKDVIAIASAYKQAMEEAKNMSYTNSSPDKIFTGIKDAYPFHPSIRELYERFKENQNFQQTRDLIRLMRKIVGYTYESGLAEKNLLVNVYDIDLNESTMNTTITQVKPSLSNAISHDIANKGRAVAEIVDKQYNSSIIQELSKLILISSLADVPNALLGLSQSELVGYLVTPGKDLAQFKKAVDEFLSQAWYIHSDKDGRLHFQNVRNLIAELNSLVDSFDDNSARLEIKKFLEEKFRPVVSDCYQKVQVFPALDEVKLEEDKITLVLFEPNTAGGGLHPDLKRLFEDTQYKNRVLFLSGERNTMDNLLKKAKEHKAITKIIARMREERVRENDPQFQNAEDREIKINLGFLQSARETFVKLYYPFQFKGNDVIADADFNMVFKDNNYKGEEQVRQVLEEKQKFTKEDAKGDNFRNKCLARLFTLEEMRKEDLKNKAATNPAWQWHHPKALDELIEHCLKTGIWFQAGNYIQKNPPKEDTSVSVQATYLDKNKSDAVLKIIPKFGDVVYYDYDREPTTACDNVTDYNSFRTDEMVVWFLCVNSKGEYNTGNPYKWTNVLKLRYQLFDVGDEKKMKLEASSSDAEILYTTNGSDPKEHGAVYKDDFIIPKDTRFVLAIAKKKGIWSDKIEVPIDWKKTGGINIDLLKPLQFEKKGHYKTSNSKSTFEELSFFKKHHSTLKGLTINLENTIDGRNNWAMTNVDPSLFSTSEQIEKYIESFREIFFNTGNFNVNLEIISIKFEKGQNFLDWIAEKKMKLTDFKQEEIIQ